jgi:hypothetical protein
VLILKGAALIHSRAYRTGMRPMADINFLIPTESLGPALEILTPLRLASSDVETLRDYQLGHTITDDLDFKWCRTPWPSVAVADYNPIAVS